MAKKTTKYSKEALLRAKTFANRRDLLAVLINEGETLTLAQVQARLDDYYKKEVT